METFLWQLRYDILHFNKSRSEWKKQWNALRLLFNRRDDDDSCHVSTDHTSKLESLVPNARVMLNFHHAPLSMNAASVTKARASSHRFRNFEEWRRERSSSSFVGPWMHRHWRLGKLPSSPWIVSWGSKMIRLDWMGGSETAIIDQHGNRSEDESAKMGALTVPILENVLAPMNENSQSPPALLVLQMMGCNPSEPAAAATQARSNCCLRFLRPPPPSSLGLWLPGGHHDQPGLSAGPLPHPLHQEGLLPQGADLLHRPGHRDALLQRRPPAHPGGLVGGGAQRLREAGGLWRCTDALSLSLRLQALGFHPDTDNYVANAVGICGGFYMLFFVEKILKMALKVEHPVRVDWAVLIFFFLSQRDYIYQRKL